YTSRFNCVLVLPYFRILPKRRSTAFRRSPYTVPGSTICRNSTTCPEPNGRLSDVSLTTPGMLNASTCAPRLWLWTEGNSLPGYGMLRKVPLSSTSTFGMVYVASALKFVCQPDSRWQNDAGHWAIPPRNVSRKPPVPPHGPKMKYSGWLLTTPHESSTT